MQDDGLNRSYSILSNYYTKISERNYLRKVKRDQGDGEHYKTRCHSAL